MKSKIVVAIIVYNRIQNIERWLHCWRQCEKYGAELVVIDNGESAQTKQLCKDIIYIPRKNVGFDIGAFQDICRKRLPGFPEYDYLLWCTDDCLPMSKYFIKPLFDKINCVDVGISCMQIASSMAGEIHVRTTGFMIRKEIAEQIQFPVEPIITKQHCYLFEHRGGKNTFTNQVRAMGLSCEQVANNATSPLWDTGYWKRLDRIVEHETVFNLKKSSGDKVTFICTIYNSYPQIISALICQTHKNWELILIHDGPNETGIREHHINGDTRIKYIETETRVGNWGHSLRQWALNEIRDSRLPDTDYIVISNSDNYYVPVFIEYMLKGFHGKHTAVATYCDSITHSYIAWKVMQSRFERGFIDCGQVMVKKEVACEVGWNDVESHSSDWIYFSDIAERYDSRNFIAVKGNLMVHN